MLIIKKNFLGLLLLSTSFFYTAQTFGQTENSEIPNSRPVEKERYQNVKGSPYFFKEWQRGTVISREAKIIEGVLLNYNGETHSLEVKTDEDLIELNPLHYIRFTVHNKQSDEAIIFQKNFFPPLANQFTRVVYKGKTLSVVEQFTVKIETKLPTTVGQDEEIRQFLRKRRYYLVKNKKPSAIKLKKKSVLAALGNPPQLEKYVKQEKLKLNTEAELIQVLKFYEQ
ncbi:MAG: hypothetical protein AAF960_28660 [Bacteroidota bacterium]